jgi:hypothetical protein
MEVDSEVIQRQPRHLFGKLKLCEVWHIGDVPKLALNSSQSNASPPTMSEEPWRSITPILL